MTTNLDVIDGKNLVDPALWDVMETHIKAELAEFDDFLTDLGKLFAAAGHELALVGGPVRDAVLRRTNVDDMDLDLTTSARPEQTLQIVSDWADKTWEVGREFGTIACRRKGYTVEITTYRSEQYEPSSRKPQVSFGDSLVGDLIRRDFTVNAMAVKLPEWEIVDPHGGLADVLHKRLRTPSPAVESFDEDPLRMMRAARFVSQLQFQVDPDVSAAMTKMADRINIVSAERVRTELQKLMVGADPRAGLEFLVDTGVAAKVLPEVPATQLETDEHRRHKDVYEHSLTVMEQAIALEDAPGTAGDTAVPGPDFVLRFAALMHDIGKPATRKWLPDGRVSFYHHEVVGAKMTAKRMKALRFDTATTKAVCRLVELHMRFHGYGEGQWTDSAVRRYVTDAGPLLGRLHKLTRADCTTRNRRKAKRLAARYDHLEQRISALQEQEELASVRPDLNGQEIMAELGLSAGPEVGRAYKFLLNLRLDEGPKTKDEAKAALRQWWHETGGSTTN